MRAILMTALLGVLVGAAPAMAKSPHGEQLPPGLEKKVERGQPLPPGWQKKLNYREGDHFDRELLHYGDIRDIGDNRQRVEVEDRVYTIIKDTREIVDILNQ
ncbi:hypothetical protein BKP64_15995 [Marinobacter salinus]|uniref:Nickel/cobalt transporter regulator n=1 Tax=Marinobacter salinus TaxID=1874317 RepID=A0A1D9GQ80_9GAMM|nr:hypothetical protein [Marinobacter salinus]AOY89550.1 hypothetical protein BKP64_15995 [Marinobacter salinus]